MEDKQKICDLLLATLRETRSHGDMAALTYDKTAETVTISWAPGGQRVVNVACDSGTAMIRDIMRNVE